MSVFLSLMVMCPVGVFALVFSEELVSLIFERGAFITKDVSNTALALRFYIIGLPFYGIYKIFVPTFYSIDKPKIPVLISIFSISINIIFCVILTPRYGFKVLALGTTISMFINALLQGAFLNKTLNLPLAFFLNLRLLKISIASGAIFFIAQALRSYFMSSSMLFAQKFLLILTIFLLVVLSYAIMLITLGERKILMKFIKGLRKKS